MAKDDALQTADDDLPVVARLVIEIRSDGTRTVARGGLEQAQIGEGGTADRVAIEARGGSPAALAADLLRALVTLPFHSSLARWTGPKRQITASSSSSDPPGLVGRVRRSLASRLRRAR
jgi:hypothetical protein